MKKKLFFIILLGILITILFLIPKEAYNKIFGINNEDESEYKESLLVYMCLDNNMLVGVNAEVDALEEDIINQKFDLMTFKTGNLINEYESTINSETLLLNYSLEDNVLTLNLSDDFLNSEGRKTLEQLAWSYCNNDIYEIKLEVNGQEIYCLNGFYFDKISKELGINITLETNDIFSATYTTIIEYVDNLIIPVTYYYSDTDECDFIVSKLFDDLLVSSKAYDYVLSKESLIIDISSDEPLGDKLKLSIQETIQYNMDVSNIIIQGTNAVLLEINV